MRWQWQKIGIAFMVGLRSVKIVNNDASIKLRPLTSQIPRNFSMLRKLVALLFSQREWTIIEYYLLLINYNSTCLVQLQQYNFFTGNINLSIYHYLVQVEVFEHTLSQTPGNDLARLLWLKSPSAEAWFERRTNYTRSLAVMSMVGYILGLGDRHPSNIMLHRVSGKVLHIDFGDCFEVTQARDKFPEKIPFRLTRMLINAMEVSVAVFFIKY